MANTIHQVVRIVLLIAAGCLFVAGAIDAGKTIGDGHAFDKNNLTGTILTLLILASYFLCAYGAYYNGQEYLLSGALILLVILICGLSTRSGHDSLFGASVLVVCLALVQAFLNRRGGSGGLF